MGRLILVIMLAGGLFFAHAAGDFSQPWWPDTTIRADSANLALPPAHDHQHQKLKQVKRTFDHRKQIILSVGMMAFVAVIMTSAQMWNPE